MDCDELIKVFVMMWAVVDPIGTIPVFIAVTKKHPNEDKKFIAKRAILISTGILLGFAVMGQVILEYVSVPLNVFQIAGGIVLFLFALTMIFGEGKPESELSAVRTKENTAVFPLAVPSIASPGAMMAAVLLTDNHRFALVEQISVVLVILLVLFLTWVMLLTAPRIFKIIGESGADILSRVMGLILCSIAVTHILAGFKAYFQIA